MSVSRNYLVDWLDGYLDEEQAPLSGEFAKVQVRKIKFIVTKILTKEKALEEAEEKRIKENETNN